MSFIVVTIIRLLLCVLTFARLRAIFSGVHTTRGALTVTLLTGLLVVAGCGSSRTGVSRTVNVNGSVGPLRVDRSGRAQVIGYAGKPDADLHGRGVSSRYEVLGYGCPRHISPLRDYLIPCRQPFTSCGESSVSSSPEGGSTPRAMASASECPQAEPSG